jgi:hypothetical protein
MVVEVDEVKLGEAIERVKERQFRLVFRALCCAPQVLNDDARIDFFLDVDRGSLGYQVLLVERILSFPHHLRVE